METKIILLLSSLFAFLLGGDANSQITTSIVKGSMEFNMKADTTAHITSFTARIVSENTYLKWTVADLRKDGVFAVYYSCNGINYDLIGAKPAIGVPIKKDIAYYFTCGNSHEENNYYRIVYVSKQHTEFFASDKIEVCGTEVILSAHK